MAGNHTGMGFEEAQGAFAARVMSPFVGQIRRFGEYGPAYEVIDVQPRGPVTIVVIESGERLEYPLTEVLADPLAETVP